jgi:hypothetical protein
MATVTTWRVPTALLLLLLFSRAALLECFASSHSLVRSAFSSWRPSIRLLGARKRTGNSALSAVLCWSSVRSDPVLTGKPLIPVPLVLFSPSQGPEPQSPIFPTALLSQHSAARCIVSSRLALHSDQPASPPPENLPELGSWIVSLCC